jgi:Homeodomain-like domain
VLEAPVTVTVCDDRDAVERDLRERRICCPACAAGLAPWGHGRARLVRGVAWAEAELAADEVWEAFRPRRGRCEACAGTQVLLPVSLLLRRADTAEVVVSAIEARAAGARPRDIADDLGRPEGTVRGWLSAFRKLAGTWRRAFTALAEAVAPAGPAQAGVAGRGALAEAVAAAAALTAALARAGMPRVSRWKVAVAASGGLLIASPRLAVGINTNPSFQMIF